MHAPPCHFAQGGGNFEVIMQIAVSTSRVVPLVHSTCAVAVVTLTWFLELPWLTLVCVAALLAGACRVAVLGRTSRWEAFWAWGCTLGVWASLLLSDNPMAEPDLFLVVPGIAVAAVLGLASWRLAEDNPRRNWKALSVVWALVTGLTWVSVAYGSNLQGHFYAAVLFNLGVLIAAKVLFRMPLWLTQIANTLIVLLVGLPLTDLILKPSYRLDEGPDPRKRLFSFAEARKNPTAFAHWWHYFLREHHVLQKGICTPDTNGSAPFRLQPDSDGRMFESRIHINHLGFRGPEIPLAKGDAYRIVTLGESTTFGYTMCVNDLSWPSVLEQMIMHHLRPTRRVQVINAGIPGYTLQNNLDRLSGEILALKPDMIISYHGINGFNWLIPSLPRVTGPAPPAYAARPLKLLADCEYRLKTTIYRRRHNARQPEAAAVPANLMETRYARCYRELIEVARSNRVRLVLANYSMAVNARSDMDVIAFYRAGFPQVLSQIRANELHSRIVEALSRQHPGVIFVDTHPRLDGQHGKFIDLVHFTQEGRNDLAATIFLAVETVLERDLAVASQ
jgi:lysophospholipase L1-like esterase